jgi:hypothetical protein
MRRRIGFPSQKNARRMNLAVEAGVGNMELGIWS